ncbi:MAG: ABC transporter permease [Paracoccaceae bacterium]
MQTVRKPQSQIGSAFAMSEVIYHSIVRSIRKTHSNAFMAIGMTMVQAIVFVAAFYVLFTVLGMRGGAIRGDFLLYIMSGVFLYLTHVRTIAAIVKSEGPASPMMLHAPLNTLVSIISAAVGALYTQVLSMLAILFIYHVGVTPITLHDPIGAFGMFLLAWFTGAAIGVVFLAIQPWFPDAVTIISSVYQRANMIASGKMFVANTLPAFMLAMFDWNPLFHAIDQARGYAFLNYYPRATSWEYAFSFGITVLMIGLMAEFFTRKHASASWNARR